MDELAKVLPVPSQRFGESLLQRVRRFVTKEAPGLGYLRMSFVVKFCDRVALEGELWFGRNRVPRLPSTTQRLDAGWAPCVLILNPG